MKRSLWIFIVIIGFVLHFYYLTLSTAQEMDWGSTGLRWMDASTIMMDYSPVDGPQRYFKKGQQQDVER